MPLSQFLKQHPIDSLSASEIQTLLGKLAIPPQPSNSAVVEAALTAAKAELSETNQLRLMALLLGML